MKDTAEFKDFSMGLNDTVYSNLIEDKELSKVENAVIGVGEIRKRTGYKQVAYVGEKVTGAYTFLKSDGTNELLMMGDRLRRWNGKFFVDIPGAPSTGDRANFITMKDRKGNRVVLVANNISLKVYAENQLSSVTAYVPTPDEQRSPGLNDIGSLFNCKYMAFFGGRLFVVGHDIKNRVSFSHIDPKLGYAVYDYFPAINFFDVASNENDEIVGLVPFRNSLIIFCRYSIWALYGKTTYDYELVKMNTPTGCIASESIKVVGNQIFYLSDTHVYGLFANDFNMVSAQIITQQIESTMRAIPLTEKSKSVAGYFEGKYYLSFPNGKTLVYDGLLACWTVYSNIKADVFVNYDGNFYFGSNKNAYVFHNEYHDDGKPIPFRMETKYLDFSLMTQDKKIHRIWLHSNQPNGYRLGVKLDFETKQVDGTRPDAANVSNWDEAIWDHNTFDRIEMYINRLRVSSRTKKIGMIIEDVNHIRPFVVYGIGIQYELKRRKETSYGTNSKKI
ncbi:hypothetical protein ABE244_27065 [Bacillus toyonensis]|uniref:hypothetical protein n=1 Tax=Bacillus toyonensis TaxID=155322 RepID=UPI003D1F0693